MYKKNSSYRFSSNMTGYSGTLEHIENLWKSSSSAEITFCKCGEHFGWETSKKETTWETERK
jgi:hypothetical protein